MLVFGPQFLSTTRRVAASILIILTVLIVFGKPADSDVYIRRVEADLLSRTALDYTVLGGTPFDLSINGQRVQSLLIQTDTSPLDAVKRLYFAAEKVGQPSSRELTGIVGTEDAAFFVDLFPGVASDELDLEFLLGRLKTNSDLPSYAVAAHRDASGAGSVVNIMILEPDTDIGMLVGNGSTFSIEMHDRDTTYASFTGRVVPSSSLVALASEEIARGREDGLKLEIDESFDRGRSLFMSANGRQRDVQLIEAENGVQVLVQDRYAWGRK